VLCARAGVRPSRSRGASSVEYGLLITMIVAASVLGLGVALQGVFADTLDCMEQAGGLGTAGVAAGGSCGGGSSPDPDGGAAPTTPPASDPASPGGTTDTPPVCRDGESPGGPQAAEPDDGSDDGSAAGVEPSPTCTPAPPSDP
jgi:Flp pilus assembly pilin Flp